MMTRAIRATVIPLACLAMLTIGTGRGQPQAKNDDPPVISKIPDLLGPPRAPATASVDELIGKLESIKKAKDELEKQELTVVEQLKSRLKLQGERLSKLGVITVPPTPVDQSAIFGGLPPKFEAPEKPIPPPLPK